MLSIRLPARTDIEINLKLATTFKKPDAARSGAGPTTTSGRAPKPDVAGMSMIGMVMEPIPALAVIPIEVVGPAHGDAAAVGRILMVGMTWGEVDITAATMLKP